jgi:hypothetical protein
MKINIGNIKFKTTAYLKDHFDQALVLFILFITIANAVFTSVVFYLSVLSPSNLDVGSKDYKYVRIKVNQEVLEKLKKDKEVDQNMIAEIEKAKDPF